MPGHSIPGDVPKPVAEAARTNPAALLVALNQIGDHLGKQLALGALGLGVHRADCGA